MFAAADVARPRKGNRSQVSIRSPRVITVFTPCVRQITAFETIFCKSGEAVDQRQKGVWAAEVAIEKAGRVMATIVRIFSAQAQPRPAVHALKSRLLAPVLRPGIRSLPAGTALYARPGPCLARQARGAVAPAFDLTLSDI
jgi:hypothetical protein